MWESVRRSLSSFHFRSTPKSFTLEDGVRGYSYCDGGISNQKFALLGLILAVIEEEMPSRRRLYLPHICIKDQQNLEMSLARFEMLFLQDRFLRFLRKNRLFVYREPIAELMSIHDPRRFEALGWNYFQKGTSLFEGLGSQEVDIRDGIVADFFRALVPRITRTAAFRDLAKGLRAAGVTTSAQLRIELDWTMYSKISLEPTIGIDEDYNISAEEIVDKVSRTFGHSKAPLFVACDEKFIPVPRAEITQRVFAKSGCKILWKADILGDARAAQLTPQDGALLDFELCVALPTFVGNSRSTFANLVTFERYIRHSRQRDGDYVYNLQGPLLGKRVDRGTQIYPRAACGILE